MKGDIKNMYNELSTPNGMRRRRPEGQQNNGAGERREVWSQAQGLEMDE